jgi:putative Ca2+/H+ antiporter (TMEM165/GDT1 family)
VDLKSFALIFGSVFIAELGDKTQLATVLFASDNKTAPAFVFLAAAAALITSTALAVGAGVLAERYLQMLPLKLIAGAGFVMIGLWTVWDHFQAS